MVHCTILAVLLSHSQTQLDGLFGLAWGVWCMSWLVASFWRSRAIHRPSLGEQAPYRLLTVAGAILLIGQWPAINVQLWKRPQEAGWPLLAVTVAGFLFTWWARIHLGALWSGHVTRKADHRVVDSGPYRVVRHPIYTGLTFAVFATAFYRGTLLALIGAAILTLSFYVKARLEERFLRQQLGPAYDAYAQRVGMLLPFVG
jgi:protein-S-isoprenylcysteine O-methyltransferase Ste14